MGCFNAPFLAAAFVALSCGSTFAADVLPPAPVLGKAIGPSAKISDWYLRGDAGRGLATTSEASLGTLPAGVKSDWSKPGESAFYGVGLGYRLNDFVRLDVSAEHRLPAKYEARTSPSCRGLVPRLLEQLVQALLAGLWRGRRWRAWLMKPFRAYMWSWAIAILIADAPALAQFLALQIARGPCNAFRRFHMMCAWACGSRSSRGRPYARRTGLGQV